MILLDDIPKFSSRGSDRPNFYARLAGPYNRWSFIVRSADVVEVMFDEHRTFCFTVSTEGNLGHVVDDTINAINLYTNTHVNKEPDSNPDALYLATMPHRPGEVLYGVDFRPPA